MSAHRPFDPHMGGGDLPVPSRVLDLANPTIVFYYVHECHGVRNAAKFLNLSPSPVYHRIKQLEEELHGPLLYPGTDGITPMGEIYFHRTAKPLVELLSDYQPAEGNGSWTIRFGASHYMIQQGLVPLLEEFRTQVPEVHFEPVPTSALQQDQYLASGNLTISLTSCRACPPSFQWRELAEIDVVLVASRSLGVTTFEDLIQLAPLPFAVLPPPSEGVFQIYDDVLRKRGCRREKYLAASTVDFVPYIVGGTLAYGPCPAFRGLTDHPALVTIPLPDAATLHVGLLYPGWLSARLKRVIEIIVAHADRRIEENVGLRKSRKPLK